MHTNNFKFDRTEWGNNTMDGDNQILTNMLIIEHTYQWCKLQANKWGWVVEWMANMVHTLEEEEEEEEEEGIVDYCNIYDVTSGT